MAKKPGLKVPESSTLNKAFEANTEALKLQNKAMLDRMAVLMETNSNILEKLNEQDEATEISKNVSIRTVSILETLLEKLESFGNLLANTVNTGFKEATVRSPTPPVLNENVPIPPVAPMVITPNITQPAPMPPAPMPSIPSNTMPPAQYTQQPPAPAPTQQYAPKKRLEMDGAAMRGTATTDKSGKPYYFTTVTGTPSEMTESAIKMNYSFVDKNGATRMSWSQQYNSNEIWVPYSMISSECVFKRLKIAQYFQIVNWKTTKDTVQV